MVFDADSTATIIIIPICFIIVLIGLMISIRQFNYHQRQEHFRFLDRKERERI